MADNLGFDGESTTGPRPTGFRKYRDTFAIQSPLRSSDSTLETNSLVSEESTLPELSRAEERAIRLSSAQFEPIQINLARQSQQSNISQVQYWNPARHTDMNDDDKYQGIASWKPSADITREIEGRSGPRHTREWDGHGIEVSQDENHPPIDIIPSEARNSTPDSVVSTGRLMINRTNNYRPNGMAFSPTSLQDHATQNGASQTSSAFSAVGLGVSMRHLVDDMNRVNRSTTNHVASPDNVHLEQDQTDGHVAERVDIERSKKGMSMLIPKMILCVVAVMIVLAAIVAAIVQFKKDEYQGSSVKIVANPIPYLDCPNYSVKLGEPVSFWCIFDLKHPDRKSLVDYSNFKIKSMDKIINDEFLDFKQSNGDTETDGKKLKLTFTSHGWEARCSTAGRYYIDLLDEADKLLYTANVSITLKESMINTTFEQHLSDTCPENGEVKTYFEATCSITGDCNSYVASFVRTGYRGHESFNHLMTCQRNFTDETGYSVRCSADVPEEMMVDTSHLRCRMNSKQNSHERAFVLPLCKKTPLCLTPTTEEPYIFNCSDKSRHVGKLMNASCSFDALRNCLPPGRKIFNLFKGLDGELSCKNTSTSVPVCRLSWCRDDGYRYILKNVRPGQLICGNDFVEQEYKPTPTNTPTPQPTSPTLPPITLR